MAYKKKVQEEHAFVAMNKALKSGKIPGVVALYGAESYLVNWASRSIVKKFVDPSAESFDLTAIDDEKAPIEEILAMAETFPMMSEKKVVWVKDFKALSKGAEKLYGSAGEKALLEYIENPNPSAVLILSSSEADGRNKVVKAVKKFGACYNFEPIDEKIFQQFATKELMKRGKSISRADLSYLASRSGYFLKENDYNLNKLYNDLQKIAAHADGAEVTRDDINACVAGSDNTYIFDLTNSVRDGNKSKAFEMLHNILAKNDNVYQLLGTMIGDFELLLGIKELILEGKNNHASIAAELGQNPYRVKYAMATANRMSLEDIKRNLLNLYETDRNIKTGLLRSNMALELFIARM